MPDAVKIIAKNKKAWHDYFIEEKYEAGIALKGTEVKSIRLGKMNLKDSYALAKDGEMFLFGMHISPYEQGNQFNVDPVRTRKLLLHKREIGKLFGAVSQKGFSIIPLSVYLKQGRVKVELGLARGKKQYDKRQSEKERDTRRDIEKYIKAR